MLPKENRLKKKSDFEAAFKNGKSFKEGLLVLKTAGNRLGKSRFGFMVSKKVSKKATQRNKLRRRLGEILRTRLKDMRDGRDNILIVLPGLENKDIAELEEMTANLLRKASLLKK